MHVIVESNQSFRAGTVGFRCVADSSLLRAVAVAVL